MRGLFCLGILLSLNCAWAQAPLPRAYGGGDYWVRSEHTWYDWEVTCPELAGRLPTNWPEDEEVAGALLGIDWTANRWPVIARFKRGERLRVKPDLAGGFLIKDIDGSSWMKVDLGEGRICFVRANARYVRPAAASLESATQL